MTYEIIASGSKGNAVVINNNILIDCGVSFKALQGVYKHLSLILLTHSHSDHLNKKTLARLAGERPLLRFGCGAWLTPILSECGIKPENIDVYGIGELYSYGEFKVSPVKLYHNVPNYGYRIFSNGEKAFYATDTGHLEGIEAKNYDLYLIEANYEDEELQKRIDEKAKNNIFAYETAVPDRHLSKAQADEFLLCNMGDKSNYVYLHEHTDK